MSGCASHTSALGVKADMTVSGSPLSRSLSGAKPTCRFADSKRTSLSKASRLANRLLRDHPPIGRGRRLAWQSWGNCNGKPRIPAFRSVLRREFLEAFKVHVALPLFVDWKDVANLRSDSSDTCLEAAEAVAGASVTGNLLKPVTRQAELELLGQELRCSPVNVHVDAVLILGVRVLEIVGEAKRDGEFVSGLLVEVGVGTADVHGVMPDAEVCNPLRVVVADRIVVQNVNHVVVDALIPSQ